MSVHPTLAGLVVQDRSTLYAYGIEVVIPHLDKVPSLPSLLGRDILKYWRMTYDPDQGHLAFAVHYANYTRRKP